ncbi:MAG: HEAT repeat domain-containing protein [Trichloromonas sp.]|nr:HEAT repeat domain-containing protein [Trichloromonas sp.]
MAQRYAFISYVRENSEIVDRLITDLHHYGVKTWLDRNDIMPGQFWKKSINDAIKNGAYFIACISNELNLKEETYMHGEIRFAIDRLRNMPRNRSWFIPVLLNDTEFPSYSISDHEELSDIQTVKIYQNWDEGITKILRAMMLDNPNYARAVHLIDLINYHPQERLHAIKQLYYLDKTDQAARIIVPTLVKVLQDPDDQVRITAVRILSQIGPVTDEAVPALIRALRDSNYLICESAAYALEEVGVSAIAAIPALIETLSSNSNKCRQISARVLGKMGLPSAEAVPALIEVLRDRDVDKDTYDEVRKEAVEALGKIGPEASEAITVMIDSLPKRCPDERAIVTTTLSKIGLAAVPSLVEKLSDVNEVVRECAAEALGKIGPAASMAIPALMKALGDEAGEVQRSSACAIGKIDRAGNNALPLLFKALIDSEKAIRSGAALAVGKIGPTAIDAIPNLIDALSDDEFEVRMSAAEALREIGPVTPEVIPALVTTLQDSHIGVRKQVVEALGIIGLTDQSTVPAINEALHDKEEIVCEFAARMLGNIGPCAFEAVPELIRVFLHDENETVRTASAIAIRQIIPDVRKNDRYTRKPLTKFGPEASNAFPSLLAKWNAVDEKEESEREFEAEFWNDSVAMNYSYGMEESRQLEVIEEREARKAEIEAAKTIATERTKSAGNESTATPTKRGKTK